MAKPRFQFSLAALLLTIAAVAVVLALMVRPTPIVATFGLLTLTVVSMAFIAVALVYGCESIRAFCIGAAFPLTMSFGYAVFNMQWLLDIEPLSLITRTDPRQAAHFFGTAILASIALGYLCVVFRWLIDRPRPPEGQR